MKIFAQNFRGFRSIEVDLDKFMFLVGDNSSGKSSIIHLVAAATRGDLTDTPRLDDDFGVGAYDYFSPYFNNDPVTFGFSKPKKGYDYKKIITVEKGKINLPRIKICSYFSEKTSLTFTINGKIIKYRVNIHNDPPSHEEALSTHFDPRGFKKLDYDFAGSIGELHLIFVIDADDRINIDELRRDAYSCFLPESRIVSPTRALPEQFYNNRRKYNPQGKHFASMWLDLAKDKNDSAVLDIQDFGKKSSLFESLNVRRASSKIPDSPLFVSIEKSGKEFYINQVGVGISQVIPVLIESLFALSGDPSAILVQQPELHLHPVAQAELGSYFFKSVKRGLRGILETHSSYLLDRFRSEVRDYNNDSEQKFQAPEIDADIDADGDRPLFSHEDIEILFCRNTPEGNSVHKIRVGEDGRLIDDPDCYHEFFIDETLRTMF